LFKRTTDVVCVPDSPSAAAEGEFLHFGVEADVEQLPEHPFDVIVGHDVKISKKA